MSRRIRAYRSATTVAARPDLQADMYALAHRLGRRADDAASNALTVERLRDLAVERGLTDAEIVAPHGRLMATGHGAAHRSVIVCEADIDRLLACRRPQSCPIDGAMARSSLVAV